MNTKRLLHAPSSSRTILLAPARWRPLLAISVCAVVTSHAALLVHVPYDNATATNRGTRGTINDGTLSGGASFTNDAALGNGAVWLQSAAGSFVSHVPSFPGSDGPISGKVDRTLSIWTKNNQLAAEGQRTLLSLGNGESGAPNGSKVDIDVDASNGGGVGRIEIGIAGNRTSPNYASPTLSDGNWHLVTITWSTNLATGNNGHRVYVDGKFVYSPGALGQVIDTGNGGINDFFVGKSVNSQFAFPTLQQYFNGLVDDVAVWDARLNDAEVLALYQLGAESALKYDAGQFATLKAVHDAGSGSVTIGARTWTYAPNLFSVAGLTNTAAGYIVVLNPTNKTGVANWNAVPPQIVTQPESSTNVVGTAASFSVYALGNPPLSYQWYFANSPIGGATSATFTRDPVQLSHAGNYYVVVSNGNGSTTSSPPAVLTVLGNTPPFITANPTNITVVKGQPATLYVEADGSPTLQYQWRRNGLSVSGATVNPYTIASTAYPDAGNWDLVITNNFGTITSEVAVVTVLDVTPPVVNNATNITVATAGPAGTTVSLAHVTATDDKDGAIALTLVPSGNLFPPGVTVVKASATDSSANSATAYFTVTVLGTIPWQTNFLDTFTVGSPSDDVNFEYNASGRQSGLLAPLRWSEPIGQDQFGNNDARTQVGSGSYPGTLHFSPFAPNPNLVWGSPAREFLESPSYAIEFDVKPPQGDGGNSWAGFSWGTTTPLRGPDLSGAGPIGGMGLLFRTTDATNEITFWQGGTILHRGYPYYEGTGLAPLPAPPFKFRVEVHAAAFGDGSPALVRAFVNGTAIRISQATTTEFFWVKTNGFGGSFFTLSGFAQAAGQRDTTFDNVAVYALPTIWPSRTAITTIAGNNNQTFSVLVPPSLVATSAVTVVISNVNPAVATLGGEVNGQRTLTFSAGSTNVQTVTVAGQTAGTTEFRLSTTAGVPIGGKPVAVKVLGTPLHIANPSFEEPPLPDLPGYGNIPGWGVSDPNYVGITPNLAIGGSLANNSYTSDGSYAALLRSIPNQFIYEQQISTTIANLTPGQKYQLSFRANSRVGGSNARLDVLLDNSLAAVTQLAPVDNGGLADYKPISLVFTAATSTVSLAISNQSPGVNEAMAFVDAFEVQPLNPGRWSVAAWTGDADSGIWSTNTYTHAYNFGRATNVTINGVTFTGVAGANPSVTGQFATANYPTVFNNNTANNNLVGDSYELIRDFIYNSATPEITLQGLVPGATYRFTLFGVGWSDTVIGQRVMTWTGGGESLTVDENQFGQGNGILLHYDFVASANTESISGRAVGPGTYHTFAMANQLVALPVTLTITQTAPTQVRLAWPAGASGYQLHSATSVTGPYTNTVATPSIEGSEQAVYQTISGNRFYRLVKP